MMWTYCPNCAVELVEREIDHRLRRQCPQCGIVDYGKFTLGAGGVIADRIDGKPAVLLIQRNTEHGYHEWDLPGGYVEHDELVEVGAGREVKEETGLETEIIGLMSVRNQQERGANDTYLIFLMRPVGGDLIVTPNDEIADIRYFHEVESLDNISPTARYFAHRVLTNDPHIFRLTPLTDQEPIWIDQE